MPELRLSQELSPRKPEPARPLRPPKAKVPTRLVDLGLRISLVAEAGQNAKPGPGVMVGHFRYRAAIAVRDLIGAP